MSMKQIAPSQKNAEVPINENFETLEHQACYGKRHAATSGLTWGYYGGRWGGFSVADGTLTLTASSTNYVVVAVATGVISVSTSATNWNDDTDYVRVYKITTGASTVSGTPEDHRFGPGGVAGGGSSTIGAGSVDLTTDVTGTLPVANGGTGRASHTAYAVVCGGTTSTGAHQSVASVGTSGHVLTSNGAGALPTFQAPTGGGDASTNTASSVDGEVALFSGTGGKTLKRATGTGLAKLASGVLSTATAGTDYYAPSGTDVAVADGGTGASSLTAYAVLCGGTTSTGAVQPIASVGTAGHVLTSNGAGALPTFQAAGGGGSGTKTYAVLTPMTSMPPASNYATLDTRNSVAVLDFDDTTAEGAAWVSVIPEAASLGSGLIAKIHWMATTATSGAVTWEFSVERMNTDEDSDSFDTVQTGSSTTSGTSGIITVTSITLTTIDSVTAGDAYRVKIRRLPADGSDTMAGDAELVAVEIRSAA